jgi:hypothetical protein
VRQRCQTARVYPAPYPSPYAYPVRPPFRDNRQLVRIAAGLWVLSAVVGLVTLLVAANRTADRLAEYRAGTIPASSLSGSFDFQLVTIGTGLLAGALGLASFVLVIIAMFRLAKNQQALGRPGTRWTPGWAIGGWFIPLASTVIPYLQIRELWRGSDPDLGLDAHDWTRRPAHRGCMIAMGLAISAGVLNAVLLVWRISSSVGSVERLSNNDSFRVALAENAADARWWRLLAGLLGLAGIALTSSLLLRISERQRFLAERLELAGPHAPAQYLQAPYMLAIQPFATTFPPGWFADPWHRSELRWWDGSQWTAHVSTAGGTAYDPLNSIPPPPPPR